MIGTATKTASLQLAPLALTGADLCLLGGTLLLSSP